MESRIKVHVAIGITFRCKLNTNCVVMKIAVMKIAVSRVIFNLKKNLGL